VDEVDVRLAQLVHEALGIGRHRGQQAALSLGIQGIEGQRRFAGTGHAGDDGQLVAGNLDGDVAQIVLARALDQHRGAHGPLGGHSSSHR